MLRDLLMPAKRFDRGVSKHIPWTHLCDPVTFVTKDGAIGSVIALEGVPFEVKDLSKLQSEYHQLSRVIQSLPSQFAVYLTTHRHKASVYPEGEFPEGLSRDFNDAYRKKMSQELLYINDFYLTFVVRGQDKTKQTAKRMMKEIRKSSFDVVSQKFRKKQRELLIERVRETMHMLSAFSPRLLGECVSEPSTGVKSELLGFLSLLVNGRSHPLQYPNMDLNRYLPERRVSFGHQTLEWTGASKKDTTFGALLSIKEYTAHDLDATCLRPLLSCNFEYISTHTFFRVPDGEMEEEMERKKNFLFNEKGNATSARVMIEHAVDGVASGFVTYGLHQHNLLILTNDAESLDDCVSETVGMYNQVGLVIVRETLNLEAGFYAQMPGNFAAITRTVPISHENFVDFAPLHNYYRGYHDGNHLGSSLIQVESQGRTPLNINIHKKSKGTKADPALGHALMVAPPGVGKTTLLCAIDSQMKKYQDHVDPTQRGYSFFFDRNRGCEIYVRSMGGFYKEIEPGTSTGFNPLQLDDTPDNRSFLKHWLATLLSPNALLPEDAIKVIGEVIHRNYTLPKPLRQLSQIADFFPVDFAYRHHLSSWLRAKEAGRPDGERAHWFDNPEDSLDLTKHQVVGFGLTKLFNEKTKPYAGSLLIYILHRIQCLEDGRLIGIYLDEAWQLLGIPMLLDMIEEYIAVKRKLNVFLFFITQFMKTILESPLCAHLLEGTASQFYLSNPSADYEVYVKGAKLSESEYLSIKHMGNVPGKFLFKQKDSDSAIGRLNLSGLEDFIHIFSANQKSAELFDVVCHEVGNEPKKFLPVFLEKMRGVV